MSTATESITAIIDGYRQDAKAQAEALRELIDNGDSQDIQTMVAMVLAAENTLKSVEQYCRLSLQGGNHGLARAAA